MTNPLKPLPGSHALTRRANGRVRDIRTSAKVRVPQIFPGLDHTYHEVEALWDTGATNTVVDKKLAAKLGLPAIGVARTKGVHGEKEVNAYLLDIELPSNVHVPNLRVTEGEIVEPCLLLIGMDIIGSGDFAITQDQGKTVFSFRVPASGVPIDFVAAAKAANVASKPPPVPPNQRPWNKRKRKGRR